MIGPLAAASLAIDEVEVGLGKVIVRGHGPGMLRTLGKLDLCLRPLQEIGTISG
jgi:hypothetical protein